MTIALYLAVTLLISIPILIISMIMTSRTMGGVEFGSVGTVIAKGGALLIAADLITLLPFGLLLSIVVWWAGLMLLFKIDFWEARTLVFINWILNLLVQLALIRMFGL